MYLIVWVGGGELYRFYSDFGKRTTDKHSLFDICDPEFLDNLSENLFFF